MSHGVQVPPQCSEKISGGFIPEPDVVGSAILLSRKDYKGLSSFETLPCLQSIESTIRRKADGYRTELNDAMAAFVKAKFTD